MQNRKFLEGIQYSRALAMFSVLAVHGTNTGLTLTLPQHSIMFFIYNFLNVLGQVGTPTFIFLSGFVIFYTYYQKPLNGAMLKRFYSHRLLYILIPYFVFSLIYWIVKDMLYGFEGNFESEIKRFLLLLATGKAHTHLYFVFISVQFYVLFPLFLYLFKRFLFVRKNAIILGMLVQLAWVLLNSKYFHITQDGSIFLSYMLFYSTGAFIGVYYEQVIQWARNIKKSMLVLSFVLFASGMFVCLNVGIYYLARMKFMQFPNMVYEFAWCAQAIFACLTIFMIGHFGEFLFSKSVKILFERLGAVSFGIYLIHPLLLIFTRMVITHGSALIFHEWQLLSFLIMFMGSWAIVRFTYNFVPFAWIFFGKDSTKKD